MNNPNLMLFIGIVCLVAGGLTTLAHFANGMLREWRVGRISKENKRWAYSSIRDTLNFTIAEVAMGEGHELSDDDEWMLQTALYDLKQFRAAC